MPFLTYFQQKLPRMTLYAHGAQNDHRNMHLVNAWYTHMHLVNAWVYIRMHPMRECFIFYYIRMRMMRKLMHAYKKCVTVCPGLKLSIHFYTFFYICIYSLELLLLTDVSPK